MECPQTKGRRIIDVQPQPTRSYVLAVDQVDNHLDHDLPLIGFTLGDQQGKRNQRIVGDTLVSFGVVQEALPLQKPEKNRGGNSLVAVGE